MDDHRKNAYRYLLYWAMLDIRPIAWFSVRWWHLWNPLYWRRELRFIRKAGALADWLHNLAFFASSEFERFDEEWFWRDFESIQSRYPAFELSRYRAVFEGRLTVPPKSGWEARTI